MEPVTQAVLLPLVFLVPGFVLMAVYRRNIPGPNLSDGKFFVSPLVASIFPHLLLVPLTVLVLSDFHREGLLAINHLRTVLWVVELTLILPVGMGLFFSGIVLQGWLETWLLRPMGWSRYARTRTAWEWAFLHAEPAWLIVSLRGGRVLGGRFDKGAFASLDPGQRDLYLVNPQLVDQKGDWKPLDADGLWLSGQDILSVEWHGRKGSVPNPWGALGMEIDSLKTDLMFSLLDCKVETTLLLLENVNREPRDGSDGGPSAAISEQRLREVLEEMKQAGLVDFRREKSAGGNTESHGNIPEYRIGRHEIYWWELTRDGRALADMWNRRPPPPELTAARRKPAMSLCGN